MGTFDKGNITLRLPSILEMTNPFDDLSPRAARMTHGRLPPMLRAMIPVSCYPLLAIPYRWSRGRVIRQLAKQDQMYRQEHPKTIAPPARLRFKVVGACTINQFLTGGQATIDDIVTGLDKAGQHIEQIGAALDFGCGCGRTLLAAQACWPQLQLYGSDVDTEAISWCHDHLPEIRFTSNDALPPLKYPEASFDLVWAVSVFTHLDESRQDRWLTELQRIVCPGGVVLASIHGPRAWAGLPQRTINIIRKNGFVFAHTRADRGLHPEWYQTAWHTPHYITHHWASFFEVCDCFARTGDSMQEMVVLKKR